jgi:hypothetical protein
VMGVNLSGTSPPKPLICLFRWWVIYSLREKSLQDVKIRFYNKHQDMI